MPRRFKSAFSEVYKQYNPSMNPMIIMNIDVEDNNYDINVSPDKRDVFLKNEDEVVNKLKIQLVAFFEDIQRTKAYYAGQESANTVKNKLLTGSNR